MIITGSLSVVHMLMAGERQAAAYLECLSAERAGAAVLTQYRRAAQ